MLKEMKNERKHLSILVHLSLLGVSILNPLMELRTSFGKPGCKTKKIVKEDEDLDGHEVWEVEEDLLQSRLVVPKNSEPAQPIGERFQAQTQQRIEEISNSEPSNYK